jgi:hypothetical protein
MNTALMDEFVETLSPLAADAELRAFVLNVPATRPRRHQRCPPDAPPWRHAPVRTVIAATQNDAAPSGRASPAAAREFDRDDNSVALRARSALQFDHQPLTG